MTAGEKVRLRFQKAGPVRFLSHHDLMRTTERMLRRAGLPFRVTQGFHPLPRAIFALPCPLGTEALREVFELELTTPLEAGEVESRLNAVAPAGLTFTEATVVPLKATATVRRKSYRLPLESPEVELVRARAGELLAAEKVWVERAHPNPRRLNLRPFVRGIAVCDASVTVDLWVTGQGTARGEELMRLLGLGDALTAGRVTCRTDLEVHDETLTFEPGDAPPVGVLEVELLTHAAGAVPAEDTPRATWGLSPAGPVVE